MTAPKNKKEALELFRREAEKAGKTLEQFINEDLRAILDKAWEIQQRTGKPVSIEQLHKELYP